MEKLAKRHTHPIQILDAKGLASYRLMKKEGLNTTLAHYCAVFLDKEFIHKCIIMCKLSTRTMFNNPKSRGSSTAYVGFYLRKALKQEGIIGVSIQPCTVVRRPARALLCKS